MDFKAIDELKDKLAAYRPLDEMSLQKLQEEFLVKNTYDSNAIEGNTFTLNETYLLLSKNVTISEKSFKEHLEIYGHKEALEYVHSIANKDEKLDLDVINQIHYMVLLNNANYRGRYRDDYVFIGDHIPPPCEQIPERLSSMISDYHEKLKNGVHPIEAIAGLHLEFEYIHPFFDGNGRTGRLILNLELMKHGYLPVNIKFTERQSYYKCFVIYDKTKDTGDFVKLVADYEKEELSKYLEVIQNRQQLDKPSKGKSR